MRQYLSTTDTDTFICPFVHAFLLAMATPARKTFATDFGQMQRRRHHMTTRGLQICSFFLLSFVQYSLIFNIRRDSSISVKSLILMSHASPLRQQLHWLSVHSRIRYELCMLCMMYSTARLLAIEQISVSAAVILDCVHPRGMV